MWKRSSDKHFVLVNGSCPIGCVYHNLLIEEVKGMYLHRADINNNVNICSGCLGGSALVPRGCQISNFRFPTKVTIAMPVTASGYQ
jgi:hypothetical protein